MSKDFEAMKTGKLAIWPWLSCPYNNHTLVNLQSSVVGPENNTTKFYFNQFSAASHVSLISFNYSIPYF